MAHAWGGSRRIALPLTVLSLLLPISGLTAGAASAAPIPEFRGYLAEASTGAEYVVDDVATGGRYFSGRNAVDGSVRYLVSGPPAVAYISEEGYGTSSHVDRVHLVAPGGGDRVVYSATAGADVSEPVISPDGGTVLFAVDTDRTSALVSVTTDSAAVRPPRTLRSSATTSYAGPSFSPDGSWISWAQQSASGTDLVTARFQTGAATVVAHADYPRWFDTAWSPSGDVLITAFTESSNANVNSLSVVDLRTGAERVILRGGQSSDSVLSFGEPWVAADGQSVYASKAVETATDTKISAVHLSLTQGAFADPVDLPAYAGSISVDGPHAAETTPPGPVTDLAATVSGAVAHVTFALPADRDVAEVIVRRSEGAASDTPTAGIEITRTRSTAVDVPLPAADTGYGISLFTRDWSGNLSPAATLQVQSPPAAALTLAAPPARVRYRTAVRLAGTLSAANAAGQPVVLYARRALTSTPIAVASATTAADGSYAVTYTPAWTAEYTVRFEGNPTSYAAVSPTRVVSVVPVVSLALSASGTTLGRTVTLSGGVAPSHAGSLVSVQRYVGGSWRTIASTRLSSTSAFRYVLRATARGTWTLRVVKSADGDHPVAYSPTRTLTVR